MDTSQSRTMTALGAGEKTSYPWLMLFSRSGLFLLFQAMIALVLAFTGIKFAWDGSSRYWMLQATLANVVSLFLLLRLFNSEGKRFWDIFHFSRDTWKIDLLWFIGFSIIGLPIAALPREPLANLIFGDAMVATNMLFRPIPSWAFGLSFLFPLTIWFSELPTYFGYCMPRIEAQLKNGWAAWFISSIFLAAQHIFLPLIFNGSYLLWRSGMFLPFALVTGLALKLRPSLMPYLVIAHALMDLTTVLVYLMI